MLRLIISLMLLGTWAYADMKILESDKIDAHVIVKDSEYKLVFFGYAGCYHFCDPRLRQIDPIYTDLKKSLDIKVLFVDISEDRNLSASKNFVHDVNKEFEAINPDHKTVMSLQKKFQDVYIRKLPDGEYLHSGFLYLLKKENGKYYLVKTYLEFTKSAIIVNDIEKLVGSTRK